MSISLLKDTILQIHVHRFYPLSVFNINIISAVLIHVGTVINIDFVCSFYVHARKWRARVFSFKHNAINIIMFAVYITILVKQIECHKKYLWISITSRLTVHEKV